MVVTHDQLSAQFHSGREFLFHGESGRSPTASPHYICRRIARGVSLCVVTASLYDRRRGYIAGSLAFVLSMREIVLSLGVEEDDIRTDEFPGY